MSDGQQMPEYPEAELLENEEYLQDMYDMATLLHEVCEFSWDETRMLDRLDEWEPYLAKYPWFGHVVNMMRSVDIVRSRE